MRVGIMDDIYRVQSDVYPIEVTLKKADGTADDITGFDMVFEYYDPDLAAWQSVACTVTDAVNGVFEIPEAFSNSIPVGKYICRVRADETAGNDLITKAGGRLTVTT